MEYPWGRFRMANQLKSMIARLERAFPAAQVRLDAPDSPNGEHWFDLIAKDRRVSFAWRPREGFGVFARDSGFGEGPTTIVPTLEDVLPYLRQALDAPPLASARAS